MEVKQGMVLYTNKTPIGFGYKTKVAYKHQEKHTMGAWPKYTKSGFKGQPTSIENKNKKHFNILKGSALMNS